MKVVNSAVAINLVAAGMNTIVCTRLISYIVINDSLIKDSYLVVVCLFHVEEVRLSVGADGWLWVGCGRFGRKASLCHSDLRSLGHVTVVT